MSTTVEAMEFIYVQRSEGLLWRFLQLVQASGGALPHCLSAIHYSHRWADGLERQRAAGLQTDAGRHRIPAHRAAIWLGHHNTGQCDERRLCDTDHRQYDKDGHGSNQSGRVIS